MHNTVVHHPLINAQAVPEQWSLPPQSTPPSLYDVLRDVVCMEYPFGLLGSAVLAVSPPSFLCTPSLLLAGRAV